MANAHIDELTQSRTYRINPRCTVHIEMVLMKRAPRSLATLESVSCACVLVAPLYINRPRVSPI